MTDTEKLTEKLRRAGVAPALATATANSAAGNVEKMTTGRAYSRSERWALLNYLAKIELFGASEAVEFEHLRLRPSLSSDGRPAYLATVKRPQRITPIGEGVTWGELVALSVDVETEAAECSAVVNATATEHLGGRVLRGATEFEPVLPAGRVIHLVAVS